MSARNREMTDLVFEASGDLLPAAYEQALWDELLRLVPELEGDEQVGVIPLRTARSADGLLLPKRAKLVLRLPAALVEAAQHLAQRELSIAGSALRLGAGRLRAMQPYPTLHAHLVAHAADEIGFMAWAEAALADMAIKAKLICGRPASLGAGTSRITGYSLVLHDLAPEDSLRLQFNGLGAARQLGCGIFVPYKVISGLE